MAWPRGWLHKGYAQMKVVSLCPTQTPETPGPDHKMGVLKHSIRHTTGRSAAAIVVRVFLCGQATGRDLVHPSSSNQTCRRDFILHDVMCPVGSPITKL